MFPDQAKGEMAYNSCVQIPDTFEAYNVSNPNQQQPLIQYTAIAYPTGRNISRKDCLIPPSK